MLRDRIRNINQLIDWHNIIINFQWFLLVVYQVYLLALVSVSLWTQFKSGIVPKFSINPILNQWHGKPGAFADPGQLPAALWSTLVNTSEISLKSNNSNQCLLKNCFACVFTGNLPRLRPLADVMRH